MTRRRTRRNGLLFGTGKRGAEQARNRCQGRRLRFESLEDRRLLAAFEVTSLRDAGAGTLRQAILDAESSPGADTITFASSLTAADDATINLTSCATDVATGGDKEKARLFCIRTRAKELAQEAGKKANEERDLASLRETLVGAAETSKSAETSATL